MEHFNVFVPGYLIKSGESKGGKIAPKVGGIISTERKDIDGEILKSLDLSYFEGGWGKLKYEHGVNAGEYKEPDNFIGAPTKIAKSNGKVFFEGNLFAFDPNADDKTLTTQQKLAKSTYNFLKHIDEHNAANPEIMQKAGWSVEGDIFSRDKKTGLVKARVTNVVFTTKPRNLETFATLIKSLEVGYGMSPADQTGFGATRKESLEGDEKNHSFFKKHIKKKKEKKMKTKAEVYAAETKAGKSHEDALKTATEWEKTHKDAIDAAFDKAEKSLGTSTETLQKSIDNLKGLDAIEVDFDVETHTTKLQKSLQVDDEGEVDADKLFKAMNNVNITILKGMEALDKKIAILAKSLQQMSEAEIANIENQRVLKDGLGEVIAQHEDTRKGLVTLTQQLEKGLRTGNGLKPANNKTEFIETDGDPNGGKLEKALVADTLENLASEGKVSDTELTKFESHGWDVLHPETQQLVKSTVQSLKK